MPRPVAPRPLRGLAAGFGCTFAGMTEAPSPGPASSPPGAVPVAPSEEAWRAMSPSARAAFVLAVNAALVSEKEAMPEGQPHRKAKSRALDLLGLHFKTLGRVVYLAEELSVIYPGEPGFAPDILAVLDVPQPEDDERMAWVVADEGRGLDLVLEVLHAGDRKKDLTENVERYARLGIPEYFVYDRGRQRLHGYRLPPGARRYAPIVPQSGRYHAATLALDFAIEDGRLRVFHGSAELFGTEDLIARLNKMISHLAACADEASARADEASARADEASARADQAVVGLRASIIAVAAARGASIGDRARRRVEACDDPATLQAWLLALVTGGDADAVIGG